MSFADASQSSNAKGPVPPSSVIVTPKTFARAVSWRKTACWT